MSLECVFETNDTFEAERVKDLLETNNIDVMIKNQHTQNLFGGYKIFAGYDPIAGSIQIFVNITNLDKSIELIKNKIVGYDIEETTEEALQKNDETVVENKNKENLNRTIFICFALSMFSVLILPFFINLFLLNELNKERKLISIMLLGLSVISLSFSFFALISKSV